MTLDVAVHGKEVNFVSPPIKIYGGHSDTEIVSKSNTSIGPGSVGEYFMSENAIFLEMTRTSFDVYKYAIFLEMTRTTFDVYICDLSGDY